jgi:peptide subunit release factor 1 (eRF1)
VKEPTCSTTKALKNSIAKEKQKSYRTCQLYAPPRKYINLPVRMAKKRGYNFKAIFEKVRISSIFY